MKNKELTAEQETELLIERMKSESYQPKLSSEDEKIRIQRVNLIIEESKKNLRKQGYNV